MVQQVENPRDEVYRLTAGAVARGFLAFPLRPGDKRPLIDNGFKGATADLAGIRTWIHNAGAPNVGLVRPAGEDPPCLCWDLDGGDGHTTWQQDYLELNRRLGPLPRTLTQKTPSGGRHLVFRWRSDLYGPPPPGNKLLGFTVRWPGKGYIVGAGSVVDGVTYESNEAEIADLPEAWARAALEEARQPLVTVGGSGELELPASVAEGGRYDAILKLTAQLYNRRVGESTAWSIVRNDLAPRFAVSLPERELRERFERAWKDIGPRLGEPRLATIEQQQLRSAAEDTILEELPAGAFPDEPDPIAFEGLAGEVVANLVPQTSASRVGLLASVLTISSVALSTVTEFFGQQPSAIMTCLVGETAIGRKGTAMNAAWEALTHEGAFGELRSVRINGIGSGEGVVATVARRAERLKFARTLVFEAELGSILTVNRREGSSLSYIVRTAFDHAPLMNVTRATTLEAEPWQYQLGILAGITPDELRSLLTANDIVGGFANRFLWVPVVGREEDVKDGAQGLHPALAEQLRLALADAETNRHRPLPLSIEARAALNDYYKALVAQVETSGRLTTRLTTIAARIALVHCQLDTPDRPEIAVEHVDRAIALTEYCRTGMAWVFGAAAATGLSADAIRILEILLTHGPLTKSELGNIAWRRSYSAERLDKALRELLKVPLIDIEKVQTGGRPAFRIIARGFSHAVSPRFHRAGPRARARTHARDNGEAPTNGNAVKERSHTRNNYSNNPRETDEPLEQNLRVIRDTGTSESVWRSACHFYEDHRSAHVLVAGLWECTICRPGTLS